MLRLRQAVVQEGYAHLQDDWTARLVRQQLLQHIDERLVHLLRVQLQELVNIQLIQALDELLIRLRVLLENERENVDHFPDEVRRAKRMEKMHELGADDLESLEVVDQL